MKKFKSLVLLALAVSVLAIPPALAKSNDVADNTYNFSTVKTIQVRDLDTAKAGLANTNTAQTLNADLHSQAGITHLIVLNNPGQQTGQADIYVTAELLKYQSTDTYIPAHLEYTTTRENWIEVDDYGEYIPENTIPYSAVDMRFSVYDGHTGKIVFSRVDTRTREDSKDLRGIYNRMIDSFYVTLKDKTHK